VGDAEQHRGVVDAVPPGGQRLVHLREAAESAAVPDGPVRGLGGQQRFSGQPLAGGQAVFDVGRPAHVELTRRVQHPGIDPAATPLDADQQPLQIIRGDVGDVELRQPAGRHGQHLDQPRHLPDPIHGRIHARIRRRSAGSGSVGNDRLGSREISVIEHVFDATSTV
jgi:hypothetical protein